MKICALIGEPASGKSKIAQEVVKKLSLGVPFKEGLIFGTRHLRDQVVVLGSYDPGEPFPGTDRFSMAAQPDGVQFIRIMSALNPGWSVFFEGDRLGTKSFLVQCWAYARDDFKIFKAEVADSTLKVRHKSRGDSQSEKFLRGRKTKVSNICKEFQTITLRNETSDDLTFNTEKILGFLKP